MVITRSSEDVKKKVAVRTSRSKSILSRKKIPKPSKSFIARGSKSYSVKDNFSPGFMQWNVELHSDNSSTYSSQPSMKSSGLYSMNSKSTLTKVSSLASVKSTLSKQSCLKHRKGKKFRPSTNLIWKPLVKSVSQQLRTNVKIHRVKRNLATKAKKNFHCIEDNSDENLNISESEVEFSDIKGSKLEFSNLSKVDDTSEVTKEEQDLSRTDETFENFFQAFQKLPNLDELSVSSIHDDLQSEHPSEMKITPMKSDSFYLSLTDFDHLEYENVYQEEKRIKQPSILTFSSSEAVEHDEDIEDDDDDYELNYLPQTDSEVTENKDEIAVFLEHFKNDKQIDLDDYKLAFIDDSEIQIAKFIDDIIKKIVLASERKPHFYKKLDKKKLYEHLRQEVSNYRKEFTYHFLLNKYITELNVRRGYYSRVNPIKDEKHNGIRYREALYQVDYWLKRKVESEAVRIAEVKKLVEEEKLTRFQADQMVEKFEDLVYETILKRFDRSDRLKELVNSLMTKMNEMRHQISVQRSYLILEQNTYATLKMQLEEIDQIGYGLKTQQFLSVQEEVKMLKSKLDAQNTEFKRICSTLKTYVYSKSHMRCYSKLLKSNLERSNMSLELKLYNFSLLQNQFYKDNQKHLRIYKEIQLVKEQSGIIHYPLLLKDYDETIKHLHSKRSQVNELKMQYEKLLKKLEKVEMNQRPKRHYSIVSVGGLSKNSFIKRKINKK